MEYNENDYAKIINFEFSELSLCSTFSLPEYKQVVMAYIIPKRKEEIVVYEKIAENFPSFKPFCENIHQDLEIDFLEIWLDTKFYIANLSRYMEMAAEKAMKNDSAAAGIILYSANNCYMKIVESQLWKAGFFMSIFEIACELASRKKISPKEFLADQENRDEITRRLFPSREGFEFFHEKTDIKKDFFELIRLARELVLLAGDKESAEKIKIPEMPEEETMKAFEMAIKELNKKEVSRIYG